MTTSLSLEMIDQNVCFGGTSTLYRHDAATLGCPMQFSVYTPPQAKDANVPVIWYLSGLTCTQENATVKAGFQRVASTLGLMVICPDTSPRGDNIPNDGAYDLGQGAGFYLNATQTPWATHFMMYDYITQELPVLIAAQLPADMTRQGIMGHSMGGHGALTIGLRNPATYRSLSAFSPIVAPTQVAWGQKAFNAYLGIDQRTWADYDACTLMEKYGDRSGFPEILIDQGLADSFLDTQLKPELFEAACVKASQRVNVRRHAGYDHSYFFISSFIEDHLRHHHRILG